MLFTADFKDGIRKGKVTRSYRNWKRPQARPGARYNLAPDGIIEVTAVERVVLDQVTDKDAQAAGFDGQGALLAFMKLSASSEVTLVTFTYQGSGLVRQPEQDRLDSPALDDICQRLVRMDARSASAWTIQVLGLIGNHPATRAADLAPELNWDTPTFKRQVRKLKALGLTISEETGYRLSPRGQQVMEQH